MEKRLQILRILEIRLYTIKALRELTRNNINFILWCENTSNLLKSIFGNNSLANKFNIQFSSGETYCKGLNLAEKIIKEAIEEYTQFYLLDPIAIDLEKEFNFNDIKPIMEALDLSEKEKLEGMLQKTLTEIVNLQSNGYEKEVLCNKLVKILNTIQPKGIGSNSSFEISQLPYM